MARPTPRCFTVLPLLVALGCGSDDSGADGVGGMGGADGHGGASGGPRSTGPGDWTPGDYPPDPTAPTYLELSGGEGQQGVTRQYKVHLPPSYDPAVPMPLVFCLHGLAQNAVMFCVDGAGMLAKSDEAGFLLVMPNGYQNSWNAGACCAGEPLLDDVTFLRSLFDEVGAHVNVDLNRVYATGLSNGGFMSYRLACDAADIFTAVAPGAGALTANGLGWGNTSSDFSECAPSAPVSVLDIHGTDDGIVPYSLQAWSLEQIAQKNGCANTTAPAAAPASAGDTTCVSYAGCPDGIEVTGCTVQGGGHTWFGSDSCGTGAGPAGCGFVGGNSDTLVNTDAIWEFFSRHSR
jgi:polyhydroxybutyrate depolymerase